MKTDEIVAAFEAMEPAQVREVLGALSRVFAVKAEAVYDKNPEENGLLAQPYADIADLLGEASLAFEADSAPVDSPDEAPQTAPVTVTAAVAARRAGWGKF